MNASDDPRAVRVARNESFFRDVNERVVGHTRPDADRSLRISCECGALNCAVALDVPETVYTEVRSDATTFLIAPGHDEPGVEVVETTTPDYVIVRKIGTSAEIVSADA